MKHFQTDDRGLLHQIRSCDLCSAPEEVNVERYINICLPKVIEAWSASRPNNGSHCLLLHQDNSSVHTSAATLDCLEANRVQLVTQTPYSPSLAPCDFFLFPQVQQRLKGKQFQGVEDARAFYEGVIFDMPQSTWSGAMVTWFERTTKYVYVL